MKRISSLFLSACLACGIAAPANASDFSITGYTLMQAQMSNNLSNFAEGADDWNHFNVNQRIAVLFDWKASDRLSARLDARVPQDGSWGDNFDFNTGNYFNLYDAYFNYQMPFLDLNLTVGQQHFVLPGYMGTKSNPIYDDNQVGFALKKNINDYLAINANFIRMENANGRTFASGSANGYANVKASKDVYTLELPLTTSALDLTPWGAVAFLSEGREINTKYSIGNGVGDNELAYVGSEEENQLAYYAGLTSKVKTGSNLSFGVDLVVSSSTMKNGEKSSYKESTEKYTTYATADAAIDKGGIYEGGTITVTGFNSTTGDAEEWTVTYTALDKTFDVKYNLGYLADAYVSLDLASVTIGLNGWYASGDKIDMKNEKLEYSSLLSLNGSWGNGQSAYFANTGLLYNSGVANPTGTLGGGLNLALQPTRKLNIGAFGSFLMGTHEYIDSTGAKVSQGSINFLTTEDYLIEAGACASYDIYDNFQITANGNYLIPTYKDIDTDNGFILGLGVNYIF